MKRCGSVIAGALGCVLAVVGTQADTPYQQIVERNVFGLKPMPVVDPNAPPPVDVPTITLEGIDSIFGARQVIFKCPIPPSPGQPSEKTYMLNEGESEDDIQVLAIDESAGTVKFDNHGTVQLLDLKTDSGKASSGGGPASAPSSRTMPMMNGNGFGPRGPGGRRIPQRMRPPGGDGGGAYNGGANGTYNNNNNSAPTTPFGGGSAGAFASSANTAPAGGSSGTLGGLVAPQNATPAPQPLPITPEEQTIMIEVERERTAAQVQSGDLPPLPYTELTPPPGSSDGDGGGSSGQ